MKKQTLILGHRGSKGTAPENTIVSFQQALRTGCDGIELDVHLSKDGIPVVIHDETVDRTTDGEGLVASFTVKQLKELDAGSWYKSAYQGARIPTLEEVLLLLKTEQFSGVLNIELKTDKLEYPEIELKVFEVVAKAQPTYTIVYSSFNFSTLERLLMIEPNASFGILFSKEENMLRTLPNAIPVQAWHGRHNMVNRMLRSNQGNLPIRLWTVNSYFNLGYCFSKNVDMIITDYPERAMKVRKKIQGE